MLFNSLAFLVFFPVVTTGYFLLPHRLRWAWLLGASSYFYMSFIPAYILILILTIVVDYVAAIKIEASRGRARKGYLAVSVASTVLILFVFKYFNFANENLAALAHALRWNYPIAALGLILPIGLSFHTFQSLSYVIEVYRGAQAPRRHFGVYALYVMFYPQLVAGPIERPQNLLHQFDEEHVFDADRASHGLTRIAYGLFKKIVIADRLALYVNQVFKDPAGFSTVPVALAVYFFAIQIYCDFSGYSDIAVGCAEVMGFELMENFERPYLAVSIADFWRRWHRSLSTWLRDYVYFPLGGSRTVPRRRYLNVMLTFLLSGLWHGANWTFVVWGALHGAFVVVETVTAAPRDRLAGALFPGRLAPVRRGLAVVTTFLLVDFAWIFFRAASLREALGVLRVLLRFDLTVDLGLVSAGLGPFNLALSFFAIGLLGLSYLLPGKLQIKHNLLFACGATAAILLLGKGTGGDFIYFQF